MTASAAEADSATDALTRLLEGLDEAERASMLIWLERTAQARADRELLAAIVARADGRK